jgi:glucoamylase
LFFIACAIGIAPLFSQPIARPSNWMEEVRADSLRWMFKNISAGDAAVGSVMASDATENPPYRFHWKRDGALTMNLIVSLYEIEKDPAQKEFYYKTIWDYAKFVRGLQLTQTRGGLGEPKFYPDGSAYNGDWGRPQNDGPALEAITLTRFAQILLREGKSKELIQQLYDSKLPTHSIIKTNLEYVGREWSADSFDLWEEVDAQRHFYTQMAQRRALADGAELAATLEDRAASEWYLMKVQHLNEEISRHWDPARKLILPTVDSRSVKRDSKLDIAVILAVLHSYRNDGFFSPSDDRVLSTAFQIEKAFKDLYPINKDRVNGIAIGRYPEDEYFKGNPWLIGSNAFAELYYLVAADWNLRGQILCTENNLAFLNSLISGDFDLKAGDVLSAHSEVFSRIIETLRTRADGYLKLNYEFRNSDGSLPEQFDKITGQPVWKGFLTWSCASFLSAVSARKN